MKWPWQKKGVDLNQFETVLQRLAAIKYGSNISVTPEDCMRSPTVHAIVTAVSRRFAVTPIHVYQTGEKDGIETKKRIKDHPVALLLKNPNEWQTGVDWRQDLASTLVRYGRFIAIKGQGTTGPIRKLWPIVPNEIDINQEFDGIKGGLVFKYKGEPYPMRKIHYIRGPARDFVVGNSPVEDVATAIAIEIACEDHGISFFNNGAQPLKEFFYKDDFLGFKTTEEEKKFIEDFQTQYSASKKFKALFLPKGIDSKESQMDNEKAQFIETRQFCQTVIAGAWGVPPHLVGNLVNAHYNNVEQQDSEFSLNVTMPLMMTSEAAMERDLLTEEDRKNGIVIRYNVDAMLRASFEERQKGSEIQFRNGVLNADEWRERENMNPREDGEGRNYYYSANLFKEGEGRANTQTTQPGITE